MSRDLSLYDSGELALAAVQLGLGHPPGQPLHSLLGFAGSRLFPHSRLFGVNLASALPAAFTLLPAVSLAQCLAGPRLDTTGARCVPWLIGALALHVSLWEPASRTEVYSVATLAAVWAIALLLPACLDPQPSAAAPFGSGLALGLSASANPAIAAITALALTPALLHAAVCRRMPWSGFVRAFAGGVLGLLPYAYLPIVAARRDVFVWGGLHDAASYLRYLTLRDYAHNQTIDLATWLQHALLWLGWAARQLLLPSLVLGLGGFMRARYAVGVGRSVPLLLFCGLLMFISFYVVWHLDVPDYNGYMASAYWIALAGAGGLWARALANRQRVPAVAIGLCLLPTLIAAPHPAQRTRSEDRFARALATRVLVEAPHDAIVIALADHFAGSLFYLQQAEAQRRDVVVLAYGLSSSSWHWEQLQRQHPDLKPSELRGPGGRAGRVRRWLDANAGREVRVEQLGIARELGLSACPGGMYLRTGAACAGEPRQNPSTAQLLAAELAGLGIGSPSALGAIADVSFGRGESLWRLGQPAAAHDMLLAGVPRAHWPPQRPAAARLEHAAALSDRLPGWQRAAALGDPARNLFLAGAIVDAAGESALARGYLNAAAQLGLPEAQGLLARTR